MIDFELRRVRPDEEALVLTFLFLAARMPEAGEPIQKALCDAFLKKYWLGWGREGDRGVVALERSTGLPLSCAWIRRFSRQEAGATFVAGNIPELATRPLEGFRGQGNGAEPNRALDPPSPEDYRALCF